LVVPVHWELDVHAPHPVARQISPGLQAGTLLHMQVPATQLLAVLPQSASMQQSLAGMHVPLQSFSPASGHEVMGPSPPASANAVLDEELLPVSGLGRPTSGLLVAVPSAPPPPASLLSVDDEAQAAMGTLIARLKIARLTSRSTDRYASP
jgi:hypothetical protein